MNESKKQNLKSEKEKKNMWQEMLREANRKKEIEESNIFIFGDKFSGKKTLIKNISQRILLKDELKQNILEIDDTVSKFGLVDYTYLNIKNLSEENSEVIGKLSVWIMNDFMDKEKILKLINPGNIVNSICLIIADLSRPWQIKETLLKYIRNNSENNLTKELILEKFDKIYSIR